MIDPYFIVKTPKGYYCSIGDFYIDPRQPVKTAIVSHAHADHAVAGNDNVHCTNTTAALMSLRLREKSAKKFHIQNTGSIFFINDIKVSFFHAGHILGSVMVLFEYNDIKYLYTGDFKLQSDPTCPPIEFTKADVLITETTFANPAYMHPETANVLENLLKRDYSKITIGAYALGKAQHITALLQNQQEYEVFVHSNIIPIHHLYQQHGVELGSWKPFHKDAFKHAHKAVFIVPPAIYNRLPRRYTDIAVFATGWEQKVNGKNQLHISDHADWHQLITFIDAIQPKLIYTIHGDGSYLKAHLKNSAINVDVLPTHKS